MSLSLRVVSRSGRELATLQLPNDATVKDLKQAFYKKCQLQTTRHELSAHALNALADSSSHQCVRVFRRSSQTLSVQAVLHHRTRSAHSTHTAAFLLCHPNIHSVLTLLPVLQPLLFHCYVLHQTRTAWWCPVTSC